jgi:hypothetical protein
VALYSETGFHGGVRKYDPSQPVQNLRYKKPKEGLIERQAFSTAFSFHFPCMISLSLSFLSFSFCLAPQQPNHATELSSILRLCSRIPCTLLS